MTVTKSGKGTLLALYSRSILGYFSTPLTLVMLILCKYLFVPYRIFCVEWEYTYFFGFNFITYSQKTCRILVSTADNAYMFIWKIPPLNFRSVYCTKTTMSRCFK